MAIFMFWQPERGWVQKQNGADGPEMTHVRMEKEEYLALLERCESSAARSEALARDVEDLVRRNAYLRLRYRMHSNAMRGLRPKRDHLGYVVLGTAPMEFTYLDENRNEQTVVLYETTIQTPYLTNLPEEELYLAVKELFAEDESGQRLSERLGITRAYRAGYADLMKHSERNALLEENLAVRQTFEQEADGRFWNLKWLHTKPLREIPAEFSPVRSGSVAAECGRWS